MQVDLAMAEATLAYVMETAPVLALRLDSHERVVAANSLARRLLGAEVVGLTLAELRVSFINVPDGPNDANQLLSLNTVTGLPESFYFRRFPLPDGVLALGSPDFSKLEQLNIEVLGLNRELNNLARQLNMVNAELREKNIQLEAALNTVKLLSGLLPICADCKQIRDDQGDWSQMETYIQRHSQATFTHGLCPDCMRKHFPD